MPCIRKSQNQPTISRTVWRIAVYIRLSKDDGLHCHFIILLYPNPKLVLHFQLHTLFAKSRISLYKAFEGGDAVASLTENNAVEGNAGKQKRIVNW